VWLFLYQDFLKEIEQEVNGQEQCCYQQGHQDKAKVEQAFMCRSPDSYDSVQNEIGQRGAEEGVKKEFHEPEKEKLGFIGELLVVSENIERENRQGHVKEIQSQAGCQPGKPDFFLIREYGLHGCMISRIAGGWISPRACRRGCPNSRE